MRMPFGKHAGMWLADLPDSYLAWLAGLPDLREPLRSAVADEHSHRNTGAAYHQPVGDGAVVVARQDYGLVAEILNAGYKALAKRMHPDVGGTDAEMERLNRIAASLRQQLSAA